MVAALQTGLFDDSDTLCAFVNATPTITVIVAVVATSSGHFVLFYQEA